MVGIMKYCLLAKFRHHASTLPSWVRDFVGQHFRYDRILVSRRPHFPRTYLLHTLDLGAFPIYQDLCRRVAHPPRLTILRDRAAERATHRHSGSSSVLQRMAFAACIWRGSDIFRRSRCGILWGAYRFGYRRIHTACDGAVRAHHASFQDKRTHTDGVSCIPCLSGRVRPVYHRAFDLRK